MKIELRPSGRPDEPVDTRSYARRSVALVAAYEVAASLVVALCVATVLGGLALAGAFQKDGEKPISPHDAIGGAVFMFVLIAIAGWVAQWFAGPFAFTRDVVCRTCRTRQRARRIPFFAGRRITAGRCACGGRFEPAMLWRPE